jgi:hypothetical protein
MTDLLYHYHIVRDGSSIMTLAAEALSILSQKLKEKLIEVISDVDVDVDDDAVRPEVVQLMNQMVACWRNGQGRSHHRAIPVPAGLKDETFEFIASAIRAFSRDAEQFGWITGSSQHKAAMKEMRALLQAVFYSEHFSENVTFDTLIDECYMALKIRPMNVGQKLLSSDPEVQQNMLRMYRSVVKFKCCEISGFLHLAHAAIPCVEESQDAIVGYNDSFVFQHRDH